MDFDSWESAGRVPKVPIPGRTIERKKMRKLFAVLAVGALGVVGQASAAPLVSSQLTFQLGTLPGATFIGSGTTGTATSNLSATIGAGSTITGVFTTTVATSAAPPITVVQVAVTKNAAGSFTGTTPGNVGGNALFEGNANVFGGANATSGSGTGCHVGDPFPPNSYPCTNSTPILAVPLKIGAPATVFKAGALVSITAISSGWTVGTAVVTGTDNGTATAMGSNGLTPGGAGTLVLVAPTKIITTAAGTLAAFATLTLTYVPEPGTLLLLGMGVAGLAALGRRRM